MWPTSQQIPGAGHFLPITASFRLGEEAQVDHGEGALTRDPKTGRYRRPRLFVMTLRYSRRSFRRVAWKSSKQVWAQLHEEAFRHFGGAVGPITATAVVGAVGNATQFRNGRHLAAWLGLVPRQYSSGGKSRLQGISRRGDTYLRTLLIHGARAVLRYVKGKTDPHSVWLQQMIARRGHNCTAVALANKNARIIQALLSGEASYVSPGTTA
jgi:hypothetical protein